MNVFLLLIKQSDDYLKGIFINIDRVVSHDDVLISNVISNVLTVNLVYINKYNKIA